MKSTCKFNSGEPCAMVQCLANYLSAQGKVNDLLGRNPNADDIKRYQDVLKLVRERLDCAIDKNSN